MYKREKRNKTIPKSQIKTLLAPQVILVTDTVSDQENDEIATIVPRNDIVMLIEHEYSEKSVKRDDYNKRHIARGYDRSVKSNTERRRFRSEDRSGGIHGRKVIGNRGIGKGKNPCCSYCNPAIGATRRSQYMAKEAVLHPYEDVIVEECSDEE